MGVLWDLVSLQMSSMLVNKMPSKSVVCNKDHWSNSSSHFFDWAVLVEIFQKGFDKESGVVIKEHVMTSDRLNHVNPRHRHCIHIACGFHCQKATVLNSQLCDDHTKAWCWYQTMEMCRACFIGSCLTPPRSPLKGYIPNKYPLYKVYMGLIWVDDHHFPYECSKLMFLYDVYGDTTGCLPQKHYRET